MNTDAIKLELMKHVERAVRPVIAVSQTKMRMRRELLAHLSAAYEEELAVDGDAPHAVERASRRLGLPAELTEKFQESLSRGELRQARFEAWLRRRSGEALAHYAMRVAAVWTVFIIFVLLVTLGICIAFSLVMPSEPALDGEKLVRFFYAAGTMLVLYPAAAILFVFAAELLPRVMGRSLWGLGMGWFLTSALIIWLAYAAVFGTILGDAGVILSDWGAMFGPGLLVPACLAITMVCLEIVRRRQAQWLELALDG
jgi:hypothetical protein